jgi:molybdopterin synthase sulfur carrier subunit
MRNTAMQVRVKLFATLIQNASESLKARYPQGIQPGLPLDIELPESSSLGDLVDHLELPLPEVKVIFVNGRARPSDYRLTPGDEIGIFPPIGGG